MKVSPKETRFSYLTVPSCSAQSEFMEQSVAFECETSRVLTCVVVVQACAWTGDCSVAGCANKCIADTRSADVASSNATDFDVRFTHTI